MARQDRNPAPARRHRKALLMVDLMLYSGSLKAVRDFVGTSAKVIEAGRGILVLDTPGGPLTLEPGDCIVRTKSGRLSVTTPHHEDEQ